MLRFPIACLSADSLFFKLFALKELITIGTCPFFLVLANLRSRAIMVLWVSVRIRWSTAIDSALFRISLCLFCSSVFSGRSLFALDQLKWGSSRPTWSGAGVNVSMSFPEIYFIKLFRKIGPFAFSLSGFVFRAAPAPIMFPRLATCRVGG